MKTYLGIWNRKHIPAVNTYVKDLKRTETDQYNWEEMVLKVLVGFKQLFSLFGSQILFAHK